MTEADAIRAMLERIEAGDRPRVSDYTLPDAYRDVGPAFLGSLDAAVRLHEALTPNRSWKIDSDGRAGLTGCLDQGHSMNRPFGDEDTVPSRALLRSILKAQLWELFKADLMEMDL